MRTATFHESAVINRSAPEVWALIADYDVDPLWRHGVSAMNPHPVGLATTGTTTLEVLRFGGRTYRIPGEVTELRAGHSFTWRASKAHGTRSVEPVDDSTCIVTLTMHVRLTGAERVVAPLLSRMMRHNLAGDLGRLAQLTRTRSERDRHHERQVFGSPINHR